VEHDGIEVEGDSDSLFPPSFVPCFEVTSLKFDFIPDGNVDLAIASTGGVSFLPEV
jgi:hypothetical protein